MGKKYKVIYADPPWQYRVYSKKGQGRSAENHYFRAEPELEVRIARQQVHLPLRKIQYAMAQNHYVRIVSDDGECRTVSTFSQVEQLLRAQENFLVCNRGVILNMDKVLRLDCDCFEMLDGTCLPVRQKDKNTLFAQFTQYQFRHMRREL